MGVVLSNKNYSVSISDKGKIDAFNNLIATNKKTSIVDSDWRIIYEDSLGIKACSSKDFEFTIVEDTELFENTTCERIAVLKGSNDVFSVYLNYFFYETGFAFDMDILNIMDSDVVVKDVVMCDARVVGKMTLPTTQVNLAMGETDFIDENDYFQTVNAFPVFINRASFCGIEWPVAHNAFKDDNMICTLYLNKTLAPDEGLPTTKKMYFGVAAEEEVSVAFNKRLIEMRGRPAHRKSMYFSWLSHGWEGMTVEETDALLDFFIMLYREYGISYDVFLFDAGIVESMHSYNNEWRMMRPELMKNMERFAEKMKSIGTQLGIWLGPDGFGTTEEEANGRRETLKWMVEKWNVGMIKFDVAVSYPIKGNDLYYNNWYMEQLERTMYELRVICPDLVVINHRIIDSPYILNILDSTLWSSMETYPDTYLMNYMSPRPSSRLGTFERGLPNYCGAYSQLLEDHGVCFNGRQVGWKEDFIVQAFGRALAVSPESYGTLFGLNDYDYPELSRFLQMAKYYRALLSNTEFFDGDFVHSDGKQSLICLINDGVNSVIKCVKLSGGCEVNAQVLVCTKQAHIDYSYNEENDYSIYVRMNPFEVAVVLIEDRVSGIEYEEVDVVQSKKFRIYEPQEKDCNICEKIRFEISSDPIEYQELCRIPESSHEEVMVCRKHFIEKMKRFNVISENAWDGRKDTAWSDTWMYDVYDGKWRVSIGSPRLVSAVEFNLADIWPGPIIDEEAKNRCFDKESITISFSDNGSNWVTVQAKAVTEVSVRRARVTKIVAGLDTPVRCKYIKLGANGIMVESICVRNENGEKITPEGWKGNNLLSDRKPKKIFAKNITIPVEMCNNGYTVYVKMVDKTAPLTQEVAYAWLEPEEIDYRKNGEVLLPAYTSPAYQFTSWESNSVNEGNSWSFTFSNIPAGKYVAKLAYFGPYYHPSYRGQEGCEKIVVSDF